MDLKTDFELIQLHREGSQEAFAELVRRHINWIHSIARRRVRNEHLAEDITQATFAVLARKLPKLTPKHPLSAWLFHVVTLASKTAMRADSKRKHHETEAAKMRNANEASEQEQWNHLEPDLDRAVGTLRRNDRSAILLRFYEQKSYAEIGSSLGINEAAARRRVSRAVERLCKSLSTQHSAIHSASISQIIATYLVAPAPVALINSIALSGAGSSTLALGVLKLMAISKAKSLLLLASIVLLMAGGVTSSIIWVRSRDSDLDGRRVAMLQSALSAPDTPAYTSAPADPTLPTPQALINAMLQTKAKYQTMSVEFRTSRYRAVNGNWPKEPDETVSHQIKRTPSRIFSHAIDTSAAGQSERYYSITAAVTKRYTVNEKHGLVSRTRQFSAPDLDITGALWEAVESVQKDSSGTPTVTRSADSNVLILDIAWSNRKTIWTIHPALGYLPVKTVLQHPDGRPFSWYECSDFRQTLDGLWIPYRYSAWNDGTDSQGTRMQFRSDFVIDKVQLNIPISDAELDFRFPIGTNVQDQVNPGFLKWLQ